MLGPLLLALAAAPPPLQVGVTLQPYYSWTASVAAGLPIEVIAVLPPEVDPGNYQPRPADVARLEHLDVLVINGLGHDDFITGMLEASGNGHCKVLRINAATALLRSRGGAVNSHTFLSFTNAIQQTYLLARTLGELRPELAPALQKNATAYAAALRAQRKAAVQALTHARTRRVITVHDGYGYLLQELGLELVDVVEPAHGLLPSAAELSAVLQRLDAEPVKVVLAEAQFPPALLELLEQHGARVVTVSHIAVGRYQAGRFQREMQANVEALVSALVP
jgi:zinc transport system substrate-binding protein